ncbi:MAG: hypothetical protein O2992_12050 [Gemmatimonadetes bacterium]|jgi:hypothetical protein|nr:hypothetical protein [Gemmatimonadota bacterium]
MKYFEVLLRDHRRAALFVALIAGLVYANTLSNQFAYDDYHIIVNNTAIQSMETLPSAVFSAY